MATTIKEVEAIPASYPATPSGLSAGAAALDADMIWQRIESHIAYRWTARSVIWTVSECGEWEPPLTPATVATVEVWLDDAIWIVVTPVASPLGGYDLPSDGPYKITATVGSGTVPSAVNEAFKRLAEYMANDPGRAGATSEQTNVGPITIQHQRAATWMAKAMQNSGAADLLRSYRRA